MPPSTPPPPLVEASTSMADAAAVAAIETAAQPEPWRTDLTAAKVVGLLCLTSLSAAFAAAAAAVVLAFAACGDDSEACEMVFHVVCATCTRALIIAALLAPIGPALVARAAVFDEGLREEIIAVFVRHLQSPRTPLGSILRDPVLRAFVTAFCFLLLSAIGCMILEGLSPAKGSQIDRIAAIFIVVGQVGSAAIACFIVFPLLGLKLWRMKLGGAVVADSNV